MLRRSQVRDNSQLAVQDNTQGPAPEHQDNNYRRQEGPTITRTTVTTTTVNEHETATTIIYVTTTTTATTVTKTVRIDK
jgi:hypothetical protein